MTPWRFTRRFRRPDRERAVTDAVKGARAEARGVFDGTFCPFCQVWECGIEHLTPAQKAARRERKRRRDAVHAKYSGVPTDLPF